MTRLPTGFALASAAALAALLTAAPALAQPAAHEEVARLLRAGQPAEALRQADELLVGRQNDAQLRFLKGVAQSQSGATEAAQESFTSLTQDYPELPEPYNNLAVLHAGAGRLEPARTALETAIRLSPGYATAYQNLGDVYARLAAKAWQRALELEPANPALQPRLQVLRQLPTEAAAR
jgi:Flp pilus assembly protein TadD